MLFALVGRNGDTLKSLRKLIAVPPRIETALRAYAAATPEARELIERALRFRADVLLEFERLIEIQTGGAGYKITVIGIHVSSPAILAARDQPLGWAVFRDIPIAIISGMLRPQNGFG